MPAATFQQINEILTQVRKLYLGLMETVSQVKIPPANQTQPSLQPDWKRWVLNSIQLHQIELERVLREVQQETTPVILETWIQFAIDPALEQEFKQVSFNPEMTSEEIVVKKLELDQHVINLFQSIAEQSAAYPDLHELLTTLAITLQGRVRQEAWSIREEFPSGSVPLM